MTGTHATAVYILLLPETVFEFELLKGVVQVLWQPTKRTSI